MSSAQNGHFFFSGSFGGPILLNSEDSAAKILSTFLRFFPNVKSPLVKKPPLSMNPPVETPVLGVDEI
jgi:hypothetical protein